MMRTWRNCYWAFVIFFAVCFCGKVSAYKTYYDILGVKKTATQAQIKSAYRLIEFRRHLRNVDKNNNANTMTQETSDQISSRQKSWKPGKSKGEIY